MKAQESSTQAPDPPTTDSLWTLDDVARYARRSVRHVMALR